jgi:hypothetical protein
LVADRKTGVDYLDMVALRMPGLESKTASLKALYQQEVEILEPLLGQLPGPENVKPGWEWSKVDRDKEAAVLVTARAFEEQTLPIWKELASKK